MIKLTDKAYIAGLVDGEGCITIAKRKNGNKRGKPWYYQPTIAIGNTDRRLLDFLIPLYGGWITKPKSKENNKQAYVWFISGKDRKIFLKDIIPYLKAKREQAEILLRFPNYTHRGFRWGRVVIGRTQKEIKKQDDLWGEIKKLNS